MSAQYKQVDCFSEGLKNQILALVPSVKQTKAEHITPITLEEFIADVRSDKYKTQIEILRSIDKKLDSERYDETKKKLPAVAFGSYDRGIFNETYILQSSFVFNGDIDGLRDADHVKMIKGLLEWHEAVGYCFISPSGLGLKIGINVGPIKYSDHYRLIFSFIKSWIKTEIHPDLILDKSCIDIRRLCFVSYDKNAYLNLEADILPIPPVFNVETEKSELKRKIDTGSQQVTLKKPLITDSLYSVADDCIGIITSKLKNAKIGERHNIRLAVARLAGGYVAGGLVEKSVVWPVLIEVSNLISNMGVTNRDELNTLANGFNNGLKEPISLDKFREEHGYNVAIFDSPTDIKVASNEIASVWPSDVRDGTETTRPLTEHGNAQRLSDSYTNDVVYVAGASRFLHWNNNWQWDTEGSMTRTLAADLYKIIYREGEQYPQHAQRFSAWSRTSQSEKTIKAAVALYKDMPESRIPLPLIDGNQYMVGLDNGRQIINLKTGEVRPAERSDYITKSLNIREVGL